MPFARARQQLFGGDDDFFARFGVVGLHIVEEAADAGDPLVHRKRLAAVAHVVQVAEACAEDESIADVRAAGKDPRFWTAGMTWAERKFPDRWGRRQDDGQTPRVIVQLGVSAERVQVNVAAVEALPVDAGEKLT
jgi:hypothetical protein